MAKKVKKTNKPTKKKPAKQFQLSPTIILIVAFGIVAGILAGYFLGKIHQTKKPSYLHNQVSNRAGRHTCEALSITSPKKNATVASPLTITSVVDNTNPACHWTVFEGQAGSMELKNESGQVIGTGTLVTQEDWTTDKPTTYMGTISFDPTQASNQLMLFINEENPSGQAGQQVIYPLSY